MNYGPKSLSAVLCNDQSEAEYEEVRQFAFSKEGLSTEGTYIFYEEPTEVELEFVQNESWAMHEEFQKFASYVEDWDLLQSCVRTIIQSSLQNFGLLKPKEIKDAHKYLRGESDYSSPDELQLLKAYRIVQDQANLLKQVPAAKPAAKKSFKV
jgi:hypothetical protein